MYRGFTHLCSTSVIFYKSNKVVFPLISVRRIDIRLKQISYSVPHKPERRRFVPYFPSIIRVLDSKNNMTKFLTDEQLANLAENFYDDVSGSECPDERDDDLSDAPSEHSDHDTSSEFEVESENESEEDLGDVSAETSYFYGRNRYKWSKNPPATSRTRSSNIVTVRPGAKGPAVNTPPRTPSEAFSLFFTEEILNEILEHTNAKITETSFSYGPTASYVEHVDMIELKAFLGLLILAGVFKSNHEDTRSLFAADGTGRNIFRGVMSEQRFLFLLSVLRFDDQTTRRNRIDNGDKLAAISKIYEIFNANCTNNYSCSEYAVVDEMLVGFRGRCNFRQYIKSKPKKYGIKIMCLCDSKTHYLLNSFVYTGKTTEPNPNKLSVPTRSVLKLISPIINTNRNLTGDNWFSSIELLNELKRVGITYVGTLRKNKREIPPAFLQTKQQLTNTSKFGFTHDNTLVSFIPKKNNCVLLISSMHHNGNVEVNEKPEIINFYNCTKGGVDALDQKCMTYSCQRRTRRWPMAIFGAMVDISRVNSYIIFFATSDHTVNMTRREFYIRLGRELVNDHVKRRYKTKQLSTELNTIIKNLLGLETPQQQPQEAEPSRTYKRCHICGRSRDKKIKTTCHRCHQHVCKEHSELLVKCRECLQR